MYAFTFERPASTADAAKLAAAGGKVLAGGQTLLASMKLRLASPEQLVDLGGIAELAGVKKDGNNLVIGAMTRHADVAKNADVKAAIPRWPTWPAALATARCAPWARWAARWPTTTRRLLPQRGAGPGRHGAHHQRKIAADDFFQGMFTTALEDGELITAISFPRPSARPT
jgi:carbon-monoxide dehydrogenase medium subunit